MSTMKDMSRLLAEKASLDSNESALFVSAFFDIIKDALLKDGIVKVKGLGTFKMMTVKQRESVNVNTGERVIIDSHDRISFTPDNAMRDAVNKPFSQFETVVLNDGVTFDDMETSDSEAVETDSQEVAAEPLTSTAPEHIEEVVAQETLAEQTEAEPVTSETEPETAVDETNEDEKTTEQPNVDEPEVEQNEDETPVEQSSVDEPEVEHSKVKTPVEQSSVDEPALEHSEVETPVEQSSVDEPVVEHSEVETPVEQSSVDEPALEHSEVETPVEQSRVDEPEVDHNEEKTPVEQPIVDEPVVDESAVNEPKEMVVDIPDEEPIHNDESKEQPVPLVSSNEDAKNEDDEDGVKTNAHWFSVFSKIAAVVVGVILIYAFGFLCGRATHELMWADLNPFNLNTKKIARAFSEEEHTQEPHVAIPDSQLIAKAKEEQDKADSIAKAAQMSDNNKQADDKAAKEQAAKGAVAKAAEDAAAKDAKQDEAWDYKKYESDPRIRHGAYRIVGVARTIKVRKGETIHSITARTLGSQMDCYVEALNGKEIKEGQMLKMPKLELKKKKKRK